MNNCSAVEILIIEDNPEDSELMLRALKKRRLANEVVVIEDGQKALDFLFGRGEYAGRNPSVKPKVVFLDIKLPKIDGLEVLKSMKSEESTRNIPVVIITSSRENPDIKAAYALGANSYVTKPVDFKSFMEAMDYAGYYWLLINRTGN